jgi:MarR family
MYSVNTRASILVNMATSKDVNAATTNDSDVASALHRFGMQRDRMNAAVARALGIGLTDLDALEHLELDGPLTQRELGDRLLLTSGAVTLLVDRLERLEAVQRRHHPTDRRVTLVHLIPQEDLMGRLPALDAYHAGLCAAAAALPDDVRVAVTSFLNAAALHAAHTRDTLPTDKPGDANRSGSQPVVQERGTGKDLGRGSSR